MTAPNQPDAPATRRVSDAQIERMIRIRAAPSVFIENTARDLRDERQRSAAKDARIAELERQVAYHKDQQCKIADQCMAHILARNDANERAARITAELAALKAKYEGI